MSRPLRIEFPGAVHHVTSRGDRREPIYRGDVDRRCHLDVLAQALSRFDAGVLAYCLMGNHFHLVVQTHSGQLSRLMRHVNGVYTQAFNRRHGLTGHLFQGRFKALMVDRDSYLVRLCRYVERNPVAAGLVARPADWRWSSCGAHSGWRRRRPGWPSTTFTTSCSAAPRCQTKIEPARQRATPNWWVSRTRVTGTSGNAICTARSISATRTSPSA
jgi:REP element-mobilizing transposase RayT